MNKFIEYDIHNSIIQMKCAIMNILDALDKMEIDSYEFNLYTSPFLIKDCMRQSGWEFNKDIICSPSKRDFVLTDDYILKLYE